MHPLVEKTVRRALDGGGVFDPLVDFDALQNLERLASAATEPPLEDHLVFLDLPLIAGNVHLYRLSWGALDWVADCAATWYADDGRMYDRALAWAHAHARSPGAFRRCSSQREATAEILKWSRAQSSSWNAIMTGVDSLISEITKGRAKRGCETRPSAGCGPVLESLQSEYGKDIDYWLWDLSVAALSAILKAHKYRLDRTDAQLCTDAHRPPDPNSSIVRNTVEFQRAAKAFLESVLGRIKS